MRLLHQTTLITAFCSKAFALGNQTSRMFANSRLLFQHHDIATSTQDLAKEAIATLEYPHQILTVTASEQTEGRGTTGRAWMSSRGNVILTIGIQEEEVPVLLTLLPLQVGILVAERLEKVLKEACNSKEHKINVKWPNDVLLNDEKIAGTLIESKVVEGSTWFMIGIGVNLAAAPMVPSDGENKGRKATCLQDSCPGQHFSEDFAQVFAQDLTEGLVTWLENPSSNSQQVRQDWKKWANLGEPQFLRATNEMVIPIDLKEYGQLLVKGENGKERELFADYLL
mmetsp:Transcript_14198/g.21886  ORF Transcript_14198/g.21886 Transcript_14198/m.21886 type:complete len:283 (+) Transcript_14198:136-984(+)